MIMDEEGEVMAEGHVDTDTGGDLPLTKRGYPVFYVIFEGGQAVRSGPVGELIGSWRAGTRYEVGDVIKFRPRHKPEPVPRSKVEQLILRFLEKRKP